MLDGNQHDSTPYAFLRVIFGLHKWLDNKPKGCFFVCSVRVLAVFNEAESKLLLSSFLRLLLHMILEPVLTPIIALEISPLTLH